MIIDLSVVWQADIGDGKTYEMKLPGTLDENKIGHKDTGANQWHPDASLGSEKEIFAGTSEIATRYTRKYTYEGPAYIKRRVTYWPQKDKRVFIEVERARYLKLLIDGKEIPHFYNGQMQTVIAKNVPILNTEDGNDLSVDIDGFQKSPERTERSVNVNKSHKAERADQTDRPSEIPASISTPHIFEVTGLLHGEHEITFLSDNSYPGMPRDAILYSSAATDETQTNWNGLLGYIRLREENPVFLSEIRVYPQRDTVTVKAAVEADGPYQGTLSVTSDALFGTARVFVSIPAAGSIEVVLEHLKLKEDIRHWDIYDGNLYQLIVTLEADHPKSIENNSEKRTGFEPEENTGNDSERRSRFELEKNIENNTRKTEFAPEKKIAPDDRKIVEFGVRDFSGNEKGKLAINGRPVFLRCETNCAVFPETGYSPMEADRWLEILQIYRSYGVNCVRFHSHCPPEAAFIAADRMGMLIQPELSHWNPKDAFESEESYRYYTAELVQILHTLANHPSFVMMTLGNELHASEKGHDRMRTLLALAKSVDSTRLYTDASNAHYGAIGCEETGDFYTSMRYYEEDLRGTSDGMRGFLNQCYPNAKHNFDKAMAHLRETYQKPVFGFEVGQFEVLPDFEELESFHGITDPANIRIIQKHVEAAGLSENWKKYVEATGELSQICYREEIEAALRTEQFSGISLLGLQDFPGQGTALVGMLNSHLQPKPYVFAKPERFQAFFRAQLPLVLLEKYTYENTEVLKARVKVANFGKQKIQGNLRYELAEKYLVNCEKKENYSEQYKLEDHELKVNDSVIRCTDMERLYFSEAHSGRESINSEGANAFGDEGKKGRICLSGKIEKEITCPVGQLTDAGIVEIPLQGIEKATRLDLNVSIGEISNHYPIWVYPRVKPVCPEEIYETEKFNEKTKAVLEKGGTVYLTPPSTKEALPSSIQAQFSTDFWSVGTFPHQEGGMGQYIDMAHPIFENFPTDFHTDWQWWPMAVQRAVILPKRYQAIITEMDSYAYLRPMAQLLECRCGNGKLLFSSMGLQDLQQYPEARALLSAIYTYLVSDKFSPKQEIEPEIIEGLLGGELL
ncbi:MAG: hypothetical protein IJW67_07455 [Blautia sp.]|nr:hypothetical protein [Blautia sp.]